MFGLYFFGLMAVYFCYYMGMIGYDLYIAEKMGLEAYGVSSDYRTYSGQTMRDVREILARVKDFGISIIKPEPTYLGYAIPISGNGDFTSD